jgi:glycerol-3-phosphate acyltransferase PlsY
MNALTLFLLLIPGAYLVGAIPWGLLIGKWSRGVDVRNTGSGNIGSSNVLRSMGVRLAVLVLILDVSKGTVAVLAARALADAVDISSLQTSYLEMGSALAALIGHNWPIYLKFKGGKGVATGLGGLLALFPLGGIIALVVAVSLMKITRYISLVSIIGVPLGGLSLVLFGFLGEFSAVYGIYGGVATIIIVGRHRANIVRLLAGTEARLGQPAAKTPPKAEV